MQLKASVATMRATRRDALRMRGMQTTGVSGWLRFRCEARLTLSRENLLRIHLARVVVGGLLAGSIRLIGGGLTRSLVLAPLFDQEIRQHHPALIPAMETASAKLGLVVLNLLMGITMIYMYAAMRPRFTTRFATVLSAALPAWLLATLNWFVTAYMRLFSWRHVVIESVLTLATVLVAVYAGARIYSENESRPLQA